MEDSLAQTLETGAKSDKSHIDLEMKDMQPQQKIASHLMACNEDNSNNSNNNNKSSVGKPNQGLGKSVSCTNNWCGDKDTSHEAEGDKSRIILSNSSASLPKSRSYIHYYCNADKRNGLSAKHHHFRQISMDVENDREHWDKKIEFLLAVIGFAVDLGNVWRFPYVCYRNGGGAFFIPYCIMLFFGGLPLFYLELAIGQYYSRGCLTIWKKICPIMKGLGYAICVIDMYMAMYYNTIIAWALYYLFASFSSIGSQLPWQNCDNPWNTNMCQTLEQRRNASALKNLSPRSPAHEYYLNHVLNIDQSSGIDSMGPIKPSLAICLMLVFIVVYFSIWKGVKSTGKAVWVTALMPYFVIFVFLIRGATLDGAADGVRFYLTPDWNKLYSLDVWIDAATQIFFSLGPGFGTLMALSSYNKFHNNCYRDAMIAALVNCGTSFVAGFGTFAILGYMAKKLDTDISTVAPNGPGLVFIVYPEAISTMYGSVFFSILFFVMLITLGLDSTFGGLEAMITGLCDDYPKLLRKNREIFVAILISIIYFCSLPTTTYGGDYLISLLDNFGTSLPLLFVVFFETIAICWLYGSEKISLQIKEMLGEAPNIFWRTSWRYLSPLFLGFISLAAMLRIEPLQVNDYVFPTWSMAIGWAMTLSSLLCIPLYSIYHVYFAPGDTFADKFFGSFKPITSGKFSSRDKNTSLGEIFQGKEAQILNSNDVDNASRASKQIDISINEIAESV